MNQNLRLSVYAAIPMVLCASLTACTQEPERDQGRAPPPTTSESAENPTDPSSSAHGQGHATFDDPTSTEQTTAEHSPLPANTKVISTQEIYAKSRSGVFLLWGKGPGGTFRGTAFVHDLGTGDAITNAHVVEGLTTVKAVFFDGTQQPVHVLGVDPCSDVAVVHVFGGFPKGTVRLPLGDSDALKPGNRVVSLGYPQTGSEDFVGADLIPTEGTVQDPKVTVDDLSLDLPDYVNAIQHGATIQHGNSGGPLLDDKGNVVGINSLGGPEATQSQYYAIPINAAHEESEILMRQNSEHDLGWKVVSREANPLRIYSGYEKNGDEIEQALSKQMGVPPGTGLFVESVVAGGAVDQKAMPTDVVVQMSNTEVNNVQDMCDILESTLPGHTLTLDGVHMIEQSGSVSFKPYHIQFQMPGAPHP